MTSSLAARLRPVVARRIQPRPDLKGHLRELAVDAVVQDILDVVTGEPPSPGSAVPGRLSEREREVLLWVARGLSDAEIAAELGVRKESVVSRIKSARARLGAVSRVHAVWLAVCSGQLVLDGGEPQ